MRLKQHLNEVKKVKGIKVWLDDVRKAPSGWIHFKTVPELIEFYRKNNNKISELSLDHDLGEDIPTGYDFMVWLEEKFHTGKYKIVPKIKVHSANPVGKRKMEQAIKSIERLK